MAIRGRDIYHTLSDILRLKIRNIQKLKQKCYSSSVNTYCQEYDAVVVGAGHNGLVAATYLSKAGLRVAVLERRHVVGGAAVTEEIIPGFKFSRASYVLSLLRPAIVKELELKKHGLRVYLRNPTSYTPISSVKWSGNQEKSLTLWADKNKTFSEIAKFSIKDAEAYPKYEKYLDKFANAIHPLLDNPPPNIPNILGKSLKKKIGGFRSLKPVIKTQKELQEDSLLFYELLTSTATKILDQWFESEPLRATLATDGVIGAMLGPNSSGSSYVLLHHVMGELEGIKGAWGYPEGGMGSVTQVLAKAAMSYGTQIFTSTPVRQLIVDKDGVTGVMLENEQIIKSKIVLSNATPKVTFLDLLGKDFLTPQQLKEVSRIDYSSPVTKINLALKSLPNFLADPNVQPDVPMPHHQCTIHLNCEDMSLINDAYICGQQGQFPKRPMIEMVIPSSLDPTLAPDKCHVCLLFTQYTPYKLSDKKWDDDTKEEYLNIVLDNIEEYAPGFRESVIGGEVLSPVDLERIFGLTGGNIFHGAMSLDQMFFARPISSVTSPNTHIHGLYLCGSGAHPGGGVMGSSGRICAVAVLNNFKKLF